MRRFLPAVLAATVLLSAVPCLADRLSISIDLAVPRAVTEPADFDVWIAMPGDSQGARLPVGTSEPIRVRDVTSPGRALDVYARARRLRAPTWTIALPRPMTGPDGGQFVHVAFQQQLEVVYAWGKVLGRVSWPRTLPLPSALAVTAHGVAAGATMPGWQCRNSGDGRSCVQSSEEAFAFVVPVETRSEAIGLVVVAVLVLALAGLGAVMARRTARLHRDLYGDVDDPRDARAGYRDPAVIPPEGPPRLGVERRAKLRGRALAAIASQVFALGLAAVVVDGRSPVPMPCALSLVAVIAGLTSVAFLGSTHGRWTALAAAPFAAAGLALFGLAGLSLGVAPVLAGALMRAGPRAGRHSQL